MSYNLIITHVPPPRARSVLARHIAQNPAISLQRALELLNEVPFVYSQKLSREQAARQIAGLRKMGVQLRVEESEIQNASPKDKTLPEKNELESPVLKEDASQGELNEPQRRLNHDSPDQDNKNHSELPQQTQMESYTEEVNEPKPPDSLRKTEKNQALEHGTHKAGSKLKHIDILRATDSKRVKKRTVFFRFMLVIALLGVLSLLLYHADKGKEYQIASEGPVLVKKTNADNSSSSASRKKQRRVSEEKKRAQRIHVGPVRKAQSIMYVDSAVHAADLMKRINFYKVALSFNRYNLDAWFGLINAYKEAGMIKQALDAEKQMQALFGEDIDQVHSIVGRFGRLIDVAGPNDGIYRVTYKTAKGSKSELEKETFLLARALRPNCDCTTLILYASTTKGAGLLARIPTKGFPDSFSGYKSHAKIMTAR